MRGIRQTAVGVWIGIVAIIANGETLSGLILSGVDSVNIPAQRGFDFVTQKACTSITYSPVENCYLHFELYHLDMPPRYGLFTNNGWGLGYGKVNLDSIATSPPDSILQKRPLANIDTIPEDSLMAYIGNVYVFKTGTDPRRGVWAYAKIKILGFRIIDMSQHDLAMKFLWAANVTGIPDLHTAGLDTFHLETPVLASRGQAVSRNAKQQSKTVFRVVGGAFRIPGGMGQGWSRASVYDVRGRSQGVVVNHQRGAGVPAVLGSLGNGVRIVEMTR